MEGEKLSQAYPEPTVGALIFNPENEVFLMKSHKWNNLFVMPGGHIEAGETLEAALKREIFEETGMEVYDIQFICFFEHIYGKEYWKKKHLILFDFICRTVSSTYELNHESSEGIWITPIAALNLPLESFTKIFISKVLQEK